MSAAARTALKQRDAERRWTQLRTRTERLQHALDLETRYEEQERLRAVLREAQTRLCEAEDELRSLEAQATDGVMAGHLPPAPFASRGDTPVGLSAETPVVYWSHAREDAIYVSALRREWAALPGNDRVQHRDRDMLPPGSDHGQGVLRSLAEADLVIVLLSPDYLADEELTTFELEPALSSVTADRPLLVPVLLRPCLWRETPLAGLQILPKSAMPISAWPDVDLVLREVATQLAAVLVENGR